jgi:FdhD protein
MNGSSLAIDIRKVSGDTHQDSEDFVAVEEPLEIQLCSSGPEGAAAKSISITMRTPGNDAELALGFLSTEGIISSIDQVESVDHAVPAVDSRTARATVSGAICPKCR